MALSRVGSASANSSTVTIPSGHKIGDLIIIFAFRDGSTTNPTIPAGFTNITNTLDGTSCSVSIGYKIATSTSETSGTWTNATDLICVVYRGQLSSGNPLGSGTSNANTTASVTYGPRTLASAGVTGSSWFVAFAGHVNLNTSLETPPSGFSLVVNQLDATMESVAFDTNGPAAGDVGTLSVAVGGTAGAWISYVIEIKAEGGKIENFKRFKGGGGTLNIYGGLG